MDIFKLYTDLTHLAFSAVNGHPADRERGENVLNELDQLYALLKAVKEETRAEIRAQEWGVLAFQEMSEARTVRHGTACKTFGLRTPTINR